jgi:IS5 family transposase
LAEREIENRALERAYRNKPLTRAQKSNNHVKSRIRSTVERMFGVLKQHQGMGQVRYLGNARNRMRINLQCVVYNIKRGVNLQKEIYGIQESYA